MSRHSLNIYVHYPYCRSICTFCAFNKYKLAKLDEEALFKSYTTDLRYHLRSIKDLSEDRSIRSVYFGGGTPSLSPRIVPTILDTLRREGFTLASDAEITIEANPSSLPKISSLVSDGVTRVSLGVQSLASDKLLKFFNREHSAVQARRALECLSKDADLLSHGFSFDLLCGNPCFIDDNVDFDQELDIALPYANLGGHLSIYELQVEVGTRLHRQVKSGQITMPDNDTRALEYEDIQNRMQTSGFLHYEVSSFARPGKYGIHNFDFWMGGDLIGLGPGAYGRIPGPFGTKLRSRCTPEPGRWAEQIALSGHGQAKAPIPIDSFAQELIMLGLRTKEGVSFERFRGLIGTEVSHYLNADQLELMVRSEFLEFTQARALSPTFCAPRDYRVDYLHQAIRATTRGRAVLDLILPRIL